MERATVTEIAASPKGPAVGAFFDLDGTLIAGYSSNALTKDRMRRREVSAMELLRTIGVLIGSGINETSFGELLEIGADGWRGRRHDELDEMGQRLFDKDIRGIIYPEMREIVRAHQRRGHTVVLSSSASSYQVEPVARHLGIDHVLCNRFTLEDGVLTGTVERPVVFGTGKADAVQGFAKSNDIDLKRSYFYADGNEDTPLMHLVGNPRPTNPGKGMAKLAEAEGWPILRFTSRGSSPDRIVRALVGFGAGVPIIGLGIAVGVLRRDKRAGINFVFQRWLEVMFETSNVHMNVTGVENAWAQRPAVFIVNHKTTFDGLVALRVVDKDFTTVSKAHIGKNRVASFFGDLLDIAWMDKSDPTGSVDALKPLEALARKGLSVLVAPEGTRIQDDAVAPFKKGAFRIAMAAGLPIVPIVIRNAEVIGGHSALAMHPGTVDVTVLPPISVEDWKVDELGERVEEVRQLFIATLENWPA
jgi:putative phosphoserine phosphatase/1-acylglycerol-3-phosphate O-acyltransferase